ncbi:MAG: hypothetical protein WBG92_20770 [Thiohalocapsa sp.]
MGGRGKFLNPDLEEGVPFRVAYTPNAQRPYTVRSDKYEPILMDTKNRARTFSDPQSAIRAARQDGVSWGARGHRSQKAGKVLSIDNDRSEFDRRVNGLGASIERPPSAQHHQSPSPQNRSASSQSIDPTAELLKGNSYAFSSGYRTGLDHARRGNGTAESVPSSAFKGDDVARFGNGYKAGFLDGRSTDASTKSTKD